MERDYKAGIIYWQRNSNNFHAPLVVLHLTSLALPLTEEPGTGVPSGVTHQQYLVSWWHCTSAKAPSVVHSGMQVLAPLCRCGCVSAWRRCSIHFVPLPLVAPPTKYFIALIFFDFLNDTVKIRLDVTQRSLNGIHGHFELTSYSISFSFKDKSIKKTW